ncbi:Transmembrane protein 54 [Bagarius yarrelli]|uniref:Transmembrane protein 54 n=1 Tax=Bagarius yarrelli TaxID=175774 RepID=A0A556V2V1_BAGYA|nr:Transmembrane protein 54 [Bagarius yarrelli]
MGLGLVLVGHLNFLLGALVHGTVLRDVKVNAQTATIEYAISNIIALVAGLVAVIGGITAITLSKNMKNQTLKWVLLVVSVVTCLLGTASAVSVLVSMVTAIDNNGSSLLKQCKLNGTVNTYSITHECPFDPTRIFVRIRTPRSSAPTSPVQYPDEEFPAERHDLLNASSPTEQNSWL